MTSERSWTQPRGGVAPRRGMTLLWIMVWLVPLFGPALGLPDTDAVWPGAVGLAGFVIAYVAVLWTALCWPVASPHAATSSGVRFAGLAVVAVIGVALAAGYASRPGNWLIMLLYVGVAGAVTVPAPRVAVAWLAGTVATLLGIGVIRDVPSERVISVALSTTLAGVVVLMFRRMTELVAHLRRTQAELAETAVRAERSRFSRDLHDLLGHTLSLIVVKAEVVKRAATRDPAAAASQAGDIEQVGRRALAEVREAVTGYRDRAFAVELDAARAALTDAGLQVTVRTQGTPLPAPADSLFGWVVREAATNVVRHSSAQHCEIEVRRTNGAVTLDVHDDGRGWPIDSVAAGSGLSGLAERLAEAGGQLEAGRSANSGWRVTATVPVALPGRP